MAESNRTERRLLDSIRRAKTGAEEEDTPDRTPDSIKARAPGQAQGRAARSSSTLTKSDQGGVKAIPEATATPVLAQRQHAPETNPANCYQSSPRVWPD